MGLGDSGDERLMVLNSVAKSIVDSSTVLARNGGALQRYRHASDERFSLEEGASESGEVLVPSLMNASYRVPNLSERLDAPVNVIETRPQLLAWCHKWQGMAYVVQELAKRELRPAFDREPDVVPGIREEVIDLEEDYTHNYATWFPSGK